MYKDDLKDENGQYNRLNFLKRAKTLIGWGWFRMFQKRELPEKNLLQTIWLYLDYLGCLFRYGAIVPDYYAYRFWEKKACLRKTYVTKKVSRAIQKELNLGGAKCFYSKLEFNKVFANYRCVEHFEFPGTLEGFVDFVRKSHYKILFKPIFGSSSAGIFIPDVSTNEKIRELYEKYATEGEYFAEEYFVQTGPLADVNPSSVNTVRIYTVYDGKDIRIMNACVRFGAPGSIVDNIHGGGMCCELDAEEGVVVGPGWDKECHRYIRHIATGKLVAGIRVPNWGRVLNMVKEAAMLHTEIGYVGWDIAVSEDRVHFIEANEQGNFNMPQRAMQRGIKKDYEEVLKLRRRNLAKA